MTLLYYIILTITIIFLIIGISTITSAIIGRIPPIPSSSGAIKATVFYIKKHDPNGTTVGDIGSGYGFSLFTIAKEFPERHIYGYEISLTPYLISQLIRVIFRFKNVTITFGDAFKAIEKQKTELSSAVAYLIDQKTLQKKLEALAKNHIKKVIIINSYPLSLQPLETSQKLDIFGSKIYVYQAKDYPI